MPGDESALRSEWPTLILFRIWEGGCPTDCGALNPALHDIGQDGVDTGENPEINVVGSHLIQGGAISIHSDEALHTPSSRDAIGEELPDVAHCVARPGEAGEEEEDQGSDHPEYENAFSLPYEALEYHGEEDSGENHREDEEQFLEDITLHREFEHHGDIIHDIHSGHDSQDEEERHTGEHGCEYGAGTEHNATLEGMLAHSAAAHADSQHKALLKDKDQDARHYEGIETGFDITHRDIRYGHEVASGDSFGQWRYSVDAFGSDFGSEILHHVGSADEYCPIAEQERHFAIEYGLRLLIAPDGARETLRNFQDSVNFVVIHCSARIGEVGSVADRFYPLGGIEAASEFARKRSSVMVDDNDSDVSHQFGIIYKRVNDRVGYREEEKENQDTHISLYQREFSDKLRIECSKKLFHNSANKRVDD